MVTGSTASTMPNSMAAVITPMLRLNPDFRASAKELRERPVHANPLNGREVVGAALNRLLRLAFALVKNQTFYQAPEIELISEPELLPVAS